MLAIDLEEVDFRQVLKSSEKSQYRRPGRVVRERFLHSLEREEPIAWLMNYEKYGNALPITYLS